MELDSRWLCDFQAVSPFDSFLIHDTWWNVSKAAIISWLGLTWWDEWASRGTNFTECAASTISVYHSWFVHAWFRIFLFVRHKQMSKVEFPGSFMDVDKRSWGSREYVTKIQLENRTRPEKGTTCTRRPLDFRRRQPVCFLGQASSADGQTWRFAWEWVAKFSLHFLPKYLIWYPAQKRHAKIWGFLGK